jgi:DHA1 family tetracycline resistance protein-like MFS transporter
MQSILSSTSGKICIVLFLDVLAFSVVIPVLPQLILSIVGGDIALAGWYQGLAAGLDNSLKFIMQPLLGRLSDSVGRKPILAYSLFGSCVSFGLYVFSPSLNTLFLSSALHGVSQCTFLICMSTITDADRDPNDPSSLTHSFGLVGVALGVAFVVGPVTGGFISWKIGYQGVYLISTILFGITFWSLFSFMPETLPVEKRKPMVWKEALPFRSAKTLFSKIPGLAILCFSYFLCSLTFGVYSLFNLCHYCFERGPQRGGGRLCANVDFFLIRKHNRSPCWVKPRGLLPDHFRRTQRNSSSGGCCRSWGQG